MTQNYFIVTAVVTVVISCIFLYNFLLKTSFMANLLKAMKPEKMEIQFFEKIMGAVIFGLVPYLLFVVLPHKDPAGFGITNGKLPQYRLSVFLISVLVLLLCYVFSRKKIFRDNLLQTANDEVNLKYILLTSAGWIIYLFGYELLFRGILWFGCYRVLGFFQALLINLALYALAHYKMSRATILGSVPAGIVFCCLSAFMGSFLIAFILHSIMATGFTILSLYRGSSERIRTETY